MTDASHQGLILDQFTRQAALFSTAAPITNADALRMIVEAARPGPDDTVLDLACGGGIVVCAFAPHVRRATGIDVTPAMLEQAQRLAAEKGLTNVEWRQGDVNSLPFEDGSFHHRRHALLGAPFLRTRPRSCGKWPASARPADAWSLSICMPRQDPAKAA